MIVPPRRHALMTLSSLNLSQCQGNLSSLSLSAPPPLPPCGLLFHTRSLLLHPIPSSLSNHTPPNNPPPKKAHLFYLFPPLLVPNPGKTFFSLSLPPPPPPVLMKLL